MMPPPGVQPQQGPPPFDVGNRLLAEGPADLKFAVLDTPGGQRLAMTVCTPSTTLTLLLKGPDAKNWAAQFEIAAGRMSVAGLVVANGAVPPMPPAR